MEWNRGEGEGEGGTEGQACPDAEQPSWPETLARARGEQEGSQAAPHLPWFSHSPRSLPQGPALRGPGSWTGQESPISRTLGFATRPHDLEGEKRHHTNLSSVSGPNGAS